MNRKLLSKGFQLLAATALLLGATDVSAQKKSKFNNNSGARPAFEKGSKTLGFAVGFGVDYGYYGSYTQLPAFGVIYDQGIVNNAGPGTIGIGGILAFKTAHYNYSNGYKATWTNYIIGVRGTYHLTILKDKNNKFDPYGGVTVGMRIYHYDDTYYNSLSYHPYNYNSAYPVVGLFVGAKYNFTPHFGAFSELGYDISFFRIGLNANF